jgi:hypothetical protein
MVPSKPDREPNIGSSLQLKVRLPKVSPMAWPRLLAPAEASFRERHGVLQVAMGRAGIHLLQFHLLGRPATWLGSTRP